MLDAEPALHTDSILNLLNQQAIDDALAVFQTNTGIVPYFQWQVWDSALSDWVDLTTHTATTSFEPLTPLTVGSEYRIKIFAENNLSGELASIESVGTSAVLSEATDESSAVDGVSGVNYNINILPLSTPRVGLPILVHRLVRADGMPVSYTHREITWMIANDERVQSQPLGIGERFIPSAIHQDQYLRAHVAYFNGADLLSERSIDSAAVQQALTDQDLETLINDLQPIHITPDFVSPKMRVALDFPVVEAFEQAINDVGIDVDYQWYQVTAMGRVLIQGAERYFYTVREADKNAQLQLIVTVTTNGETETLHSNITDVVQDTPLDLHHPLYLTFDPVSVSYSLTENSTIWLDSVVSLTGATLDYQWYRIPEHGTWHENGVALANNETQPLVNPDDVNYFHRVKITVTTNDGSIDLLSNPSSVWRPNDRPDTDHQVEMTRAFYKDILLITGGTNPANDGQRLTAVLRGGDLSKDELPPQVDYQWYHSTNQSTWQPLIGEDTAHLSLTTSEQGYVKVQVTYQDALGAMPTLEESRPVVLRTGSYQSDWRVSIEPIENMPVGQTLKAKHRALEPTNNESVSYQWYRLATPYDWASRVPLANPTPNQLHHTYTVLTEDVGHYIVVEATLSDGTNTNVAKSLPVGSTYLDLHRDPSNNSGIDYALTNLQISPEPLLEGATLSGHYSVLENQFLKQNEPLQMIEWFAVADPNDLYRDERLWQSLPTGNLNGSYVGQYVVMKVVHLINGQQVTAATISDQVEADYLNPIDESIWPSLVVGTPDPLNRLSVMDVVAKTDENGALLETGDPADYDHQFSYISAVTGKMYDSLIELTDASEEANTKAVTVKVRQTERNPVTPPARFRFIKQQFALANSTQLNNWLDGNGFALRASKRYLYPDTPYRLRVIQTGNGGANGLAQAAHLNFDFKADGETLNAVPDQFYSEHTAPETTDIDREIPISVVISNRQNSDTLTHELKGFTPIVAALPSPSLQYLEPFTDGSFLKVHPAFVSQLTRLIGANNIRGYELIQESNGLPVEQNVTGTFEMSVSAVNPAPPAIALPAIALNERYRIRVRVNFDGQPRSFTSNLSPPLVDKVSASTSQTDDYSVFGGITGNVGTGEEVGHDLRLIELLTENYAEYDTLNVRWFLIDDPQEAYDVSALPATAAIGNTDSVTLGDDAANKYVLLEGDLIKDGQTYAYQAISDVILLNDRDGDGVSDDVDLFPDNPDEHADTDLDGIGIPGHQTRVNVVPITIDDSYEVTPNSTYILEPLLNDFDQNSDDVISLRNATSKYGEVLVLADNTIQLTLPSVIPQEWSMTYHIVDSHGALAMGW